MTSPSHDGRPAIRRRAGRAFWGVVACLAFGSSLCGLPGIFGGGAAAATPEPQGANRETREIAAQLIPFPQLTDETQQKLWSVCHRPTFYRRLPVQNITCQRDMYLFFVRSPEVIVNMWQLMGATNVVLKRSGPFTYEAADGAGTQSKIELVYGTPDTHVLYGDGFYEGPLLKRRVNGRCVMVLKSGYSQDETKSDAIASQLDVFLQLDNVGIDLLAKTLHPLLGKTADHNFAETALFVGRVSQALEQNPSGADRLAPRLNNVTLDVRDQFVRTAHAVGRAGATRTVSLGENSGELKLSPMRR